MDYDLDENRCDKREIAKKPTVRDCLENFFHQELGCNIPWHLTKDGEKEDCATMEKFNQYQSLAGRFASMNSRQMGQETGCMRRCRRMEYKLWETSPIGSKTKYPPELVKLSFTISSGK